MHVSVWEEWQFKRPQVIQCKRSVKLVLALLCTRLLSLRWMHPPIGLISCALQFGTYHFMPAALPFPHAAVFPLTYGEAERASGLCLRGLMCDDSVIVASNVLQRISFQGPSDSCSARMRCSSYNVRYLGWHVATLIWWHALHMPGSAGPVLPPAPQEVV